MRLHDLYPLPAGEPVVSREDLAIWRRWEQEAILWARFPLHQIRVDDARKTVEAMLEAAPDAYVAWSGGKDSTAMTCLLHDMGLMVQVMSVKDDLDFPGEEAYVRGLAARWELPLDIIRPPHSLQAWLTDHAETFNPRVDAHSRGARLSAEGFYAPVHQYAEQHGFPGVFLGLRTEESSGRRANRAARGKIYRKKNGEIVCTPIADWKSLDVYAFLLSRGVPLLPLYQCVRLHEHPGLIRKSWWLPGAHHDFGGARWLRTYYPSLWRRLCELVPAARMHR